MISELEKAIVILCTAPAEGGHAERLARGLVTAGLAACVNLVGGVRSVYRWQGEIHDDAEVQLVIKTRSDRFDEVAAWLAAQHPYAVPEILALDVSRGSPAYLEWLATQTTSAD